jgi:hypothetical protein
MRAKSEECGGALDAQRVGRTGERRLADRRPSGQVVDHVQSVGLALERGASGRRLEIPGAETAKEADDRIASEVRGVGHRRTPVAVAAKQHLLVDQRGIPCNEGAHAFDVVAPDRVRELDGVDEPRPARRLVAAREDELRVGQLRG